MATRVDNDQVPTQDTIEKLLRYLDILYPNGEPINPRQGDDDGYPVYKGEVDDFYRLVEDRLVQSPRFHEKRIRTMHTPRLDPECQLERRQSDAHLLKERFFSGEQGRAISVGI